MLFLWNVSHVLEGEIINVLNCFSTAGDIPYLKLILSARLEDLCQLNHNFFIPLASMINPLAVIPDLEAAIGEIFTRKVH